MPVTRFFVAEGEALGVADAEPVGVGVALDVGETVALDDELGAGEGEELVLDVGEALALTLALGVDEEAVEEAGLAVVAEAVALAVGDGSKVPTRAITELDEDGDGELLALLVGAEGDAELETVGLALNVAVATGVAEADVAVAEGTAVVDGLAVAVDVGLAEFEAEGVALPDTDGDADGRGVAEVHFSGIVVAVVITPPVSADAITGTEAKIESTRALTAETTIVLERRE